MSRDISRSMWAWQALFRVPRWGVGRWSVILSGALRNEESGWGRYDHSYCHSEEQRSCDVGVSPVGVWPTAGKCLCRPKERFSRRTCRPPQNDRTVLSPSHIIPNQILHYVQNDRVEIVSKKPPIPIFRQNAADATLRKSETMGCTERTAHCRATRRGSRCGVFTENHQRTTTPFFVKRR